MKTLLPFTRVSLHLKLSCFEFVSFGVIFLLLVFAAVCFFVAALCLNFSKSELMSSLSIQIVVELSVLIFMSRMTPELHSVFLSTVRYIDTVEDITLNINKKKFFALPMRVIFVIFCCCLMSLFYVSQWWEIAQMTRDINSREQQWTKRRVILARGMGGWNFSVEILRLTYYFIDGKEKLSFRRHSFSSLRWTLEIMQHHCVPNIFFLVVISSSHHYVNDRMEEKLRGKFYAMQFNQWRLFFFCFAKLSSLGGV